MGNLFDDRTDDLLQLFAAQSNWREFDKSGLMNHMTRFDDIGCTYMHGDKSPVSVVQFSGQGCAWLRDNGLMEGVIDAWQDRTTRIDLANDFVTDAHPKDVAESVSNPRIKSGGSEVSDTGITYYVGSYKSDRYAAVYRYSDKLKRGGTLRVEYRFSNQQAKWCAAMCRDKGVFDVFSEVHNVYGWRHDGVVLDAGDSKFKSAPRPRTAAGKELWLVKQVIPSLIKEAEKGNIALLVELKDKLCGIIDEYISFKEG
jgi:hypothetical protein